MIAVTPITADDRADWLPLWQGYLAFYKTELDDATTDATFARITSPGSGLHGAFARDEDGNPIGFVHWLPHPATWTTTDYTYLEDLFVSPDARGGGAGRALIAHVRAWAQEHGSSKVYWLTDDANSVARRLYDAVASDSGSVHYEIKL